MASVCKGMATVFVASALCLIGCGGNELDGSWTASESSQGTAIKVTIDLNSDGSATFDSKITELLGATCTGSLDYTGYMWTSTATTVTITGNATCKTSAVCTAAGKQAPIPCSAKDNVSGTCHYKLQNDDDALVLSDCSNDTTMTSVTYARVE